MTLVEEEMAIDKLLTCSKRKECVEQDISTFSREEICSWKPVAPVCMFVKPKKTKGLRNKRKLQYWKQHLFQSLSDDAKENYPYCDHLRNLSYCSTNVLSYDCPSSRTIVDMRTFKYVERENLPNFYIIENSCTRSQNDGAYNIQVEDFCRLADDETMSDIKRQMYMDNPNENCWNLLSSYAIHEPEVLLKPVKPPSQFQMQLAAGKPLSFDEQLKLMTIKLQKNEEEKEVTNGIFVSNSKNDANQENNKIKYVKVKSKCKKKRKRDHELVKIRTYLPLVSKNNGKSPNIDESEDELDFPFKVSGVRNGKRVTQDISINKLTHFVIDERDLTNCSREKLEKVKEKIELPPIAGLHIS